MGGRRWKRRARNVGIITIKPTGINHKRTQEMLELKDSSESSSKKGILDDLQGSFLMAKAIVQPRQIL